MAHPISYIFVVLIHSLIPITTRYGSRVMTTCWIWFSSKYKSIHINPSNDSSLLFLLLSGPRKFWAWLEFRVDSWRGAALGDVGPNLFLFWHWSHTYGSVVGVYFSAFHGKNLFCIMRYYKMAYIGYRLAKRARKISLKNSTFCSKQRRKKRTIFFKAFMKLVVLNVVFSSN